MREFLTESPALPGSPTPEPEVQQQPEAEAAAAGAADVAAGAASDDGGVSAGSLVSALLKVGPGGARVCESPAKRTQPSVAHWFIKRFCVPVFYADILLFPLVVPLPLTACNALRSAPSLLRPSSAPAPQSTYRQFRPGQGEMRHGTEGWKCLETSMKALQVRVRGVAGVVVGECWWWLEMQVCVSLVSCTRGRGMQ